MKNQQRIIPAVMALIAAVLFYKQSIGLNVALFTFISVILLLLQHKEKLLRTIALCIPPVLSSVFIAVYPQAFTYVVWLVSYLVMWSAFYVPLKPLLLPLQGVSSIILKLKGIFSKVNNSANNQPKSKGSILVTLATAIIVVVFFSLYAASNPLFADVVNKIDLSFISVGFLFSLLLYYVLMNGLIFQQINKKLLLKNEKPNCLETVAEETERDQLEFRIATYSFLAVSCLLIFINVLDLVSLVSGNLPEGITYSQYVHQGFNTLIFSMVLAIAVVLYFFRSGINFHQKISRLRRVAFLWISQNIVLALITGMKNTLYVESLGLTYKRIAVYLFLMCVLVALMLCVKKIRAPYTNWYFFNKAAFLAYVSATLFVLVPYDWVITRYNLQYSQTTDIPYLLTLSKPDLLELKNYADSKKHLPFNLKTRIDQKIIRKEQTADQQDWQSWTLYYNQFNTVKDENYAH